jgi:hypothetical protein
MLELEKREGFDVFLFSKSWFKIKQSYISPENLSCAFFFASIPLLWKSIFSRMVYLGVTALGFGISFLGNLPSL